MPDQPTTTPPPQQPTASPTPAPTIPVSIEQYQRYVSLEAQLAEFQSQQQTMIDLKETERLKALAEKGQVEEAMTQQRKAWETKIAETVAAHAKLESEVREHHREAVITNAFSGLTFAGDTPEQKAFAASAVRRELADELETSRDASGVLHVRQKGTGIPADQFIREKLANPRYAGILAAAKTGGTGGGGDRPAIGEPAAPPKPFEPGSVAERVANFMKARSTAWGLHAVSK